MSYQLQDERVPAGKIAALQYVVAGTLLLLLLGYWHLQVGRHQYYEEQAQRNRIRNLPVIAPRGRILDRQGRVLVDNFPAFSVLLMRESATPLSQDRISAIAQGLGLDRNDLAGLVARTASLPRFQPVVLKQSATLEDVSFVESHRTEYPELDLIQVSQRLYPKQEVAAALLGYVGEVSEAAVAKPDSPYRPGDVVGKFGIEAQYDDILAGRDGMRRVVVNSRGQEVGSMTAINALPGRDLRLTVDLDLQMTAEAALGDQPGAVVALDPNTGEVLALVSHPSFDPNEFAHRISGAEWQQLMDDPFHPLTNKAIQAHLAPGSVFKVVTATAALETGAISPNYSLICPGFVTIYGHTYHDWTFDKHKGHGYVDLHRALVVSCDVYFYTLGKLLGIDTLAHYGKGLGLGSRTGIDLPGEDPGLMPSPEWVEKAFKRKWWAGETMSVAIGQGAVAVTPLQLATMVSGVALGGVFPRPHLVFSDDLRQLRIDPPKDDARRFALKTDTVEVLSKALWGVVNEGGGTGGGAHLAGLDVCGKTGTAQVVSVGLQKSEHKAEFNNNAWFVGYAPNNSPEIVVAVLVMGGGHSTVATPIAREVIKAYWEAKHPGATQRDQTAAVARGPDAIPLAAAATSVGAMPDR
jgi:penicillin-binding protein 2